MIFFAQVLGLAIQILLYGKLHVNLFTCALLVDAELMEEDFETNM